MVDLIASRLLENGKYVCLWQVENEYYVTCQKKDNLREFENEYMYAKPYHKLENALDVFTYLTL